MRSPMKKLFLLVALTSGMLLFGCELIVDFDRTKIAGEEVPETGAVDSGGRGEAGPTDSGGNTDGGGDAEDAANDVQDASDSG